MIKQPSIIEKSLGKLQIYVRPTDKIKPLSLAHSLRSRQLYRELVKYAKDDKLLNASVFQTHHGYTMHNKISSAHVELPEHELYLCVELIDEKQKLENYCKKHGAILKDKMIVYRPVEFWEITDSNKQTL